MRALRFFAPKAADARLLALPFLSTAITNEEAQLAVALGVERLDSSKYVREHLEPVYRPCPRPSAVPLCAAVLLSCYMVLSCYAAVLLQRRCPAMLLCFCKGAAAAILLCCFAGRSLLIMCMHDRQVKLTGGPGHESQMVIPYRQVHPYTRKWRAFSPATGDHECTRNVFL